jgi:hypothetical protein
MTLNEEQENEVRKRVVEQFGEDSVKEMDRHYMELNDIRITCKDSYEFLEKVKAKYPEENTNLLLSAILYGMRQGELAVEYHFRAQSQSTGGKKPLPSFGSAS